MEAMQFEPMSVGRIIDRTFTLYRNNFVRFITIVAIIQVPIGLLSVVSNSFLLAGISGETYKSEAAPESSETTELRSETDSETRPSAPREERANALLAIFAAIGAVISALLMIMGGMLSQAALTKSVSETYLGRDISVGQAYKSILPRFLSLIGASILVTLVVWFGLVLLVVPGIIFGLWLFLTTPCIVVEDCRATDGMARSKALVSGNLGKVFAVGLVSLLIAWAVMIPASMIGSSVALLVGPDHMMLSMFVSQFLDMLGRILSTPIGAAASILLYYDLRIRKEGFDLQMLAQSAGPDRG